MIVTLTLNPALDLTYHLQHWLPGETMRVPAASLRAGGKGLNVSRVLHEQGRATHVVAPVGGSTGSAVVADLEASGIEHSLLQVEHATRTSLALVTPDQTSNVSEIGNPLSASDLDRLLELVDRALVLSPHPVLVCSGSMPPEIPAGIAARIIAIARERNAPVLVDTSGDHLLAAADAGADVLKPNRDELAAATGDDDPATAARTLCARSGGTVFASLGAQGLLRVDARSTRHARLPRPLVGNTTGAGDAAVAAIAVGLHDRLGVDETLTLATAWSAAAVLHPLAGSVTDPGPLLDQITIERD